MTDLCARCKMFPVESATNSRKIKPSTTWCRACIRLEKYMHRLPEVKVRGRREIIPVSNPQECAHDKVKMAVRKMWRSGQCISTCYIQRKWSLDYVTALAILNEIKEEEF